METRERETHRRGYSTKSVIQKLNSPHRIPSSDVSTDRINHAPLQSLSDLVQPSTSQVRIDIKTPLHLRHSASLPQPSLSSTTSLSSVLINSYIHHHHTSPPLFLARSRASKRRNTYKKQNEAYILPSAGSCVAICPGIRQRAGFCSAVVFFSVHAVLGLGPGHVRNEGSKALG